jgi:hypothetical protein
VADRQGKASKISLFKDQVSTQLDIDNLSYSDWAQKNFANPRDNYQPFSFKDHDFQIEILDCPEQNTVTQKPAQVGLSTLAIIYALTFSALSRYKKLGYVLPSSKFANEFSATRVDPILQSCPVLASMLSEGGLDNVAARKIGTNFLMMKGTSTGASSVSVDFDALVFDEVDLCDQEVLGQFTSRLQHSDLKITRSFSTPTVSEYGVNQRFIASSQAHRAILCQACNTWQIIMDFFDSVRVPTIHGFQDPKELEKENVSQILSVITEDPYLSCPHCHKKLTTENLNDPIKREWVHSYPNNLTKGFQVSFWDVPRYNPVKDVFASLERYASKAAWVNFRLGIPFESKDTSLSIGQRSGYPHESSDNILSRNVFIGADLGKKASHIIVGVPVHGVDSKVILQVIAFWRVDVTALPDKSLANYLTKLIKLTNATRLVLDAMPNYETSLQLHSSRHTQGIAFGAEYTSNKPTSSLDIYTFKESVGIVKIARTLSMDALSRALKVGNVRFPAHTIDRKEDEVMEGHMGCIKKVQEKWVSTSTEDHYAHALNYLYAAYSSVNERFVQMQVVMPPTASGVVVGG